MNARQWFESGPLLCLDETSAEKWLRQEVELRCSTGAYSPEEARQHIVDEIGYMTGWYDMDVAWRMFTLFGAEHPVWGKPQVRESLTQFDFYQLVDAIHMIRNDCVEAEA